jgi:hypothetical protein
LTAPLFDSCQSQNFANPGAVKLAKDRFFLHIFIKVLFNLKSSYLKLKIEKNDGVQGPIEAGISYYRQRATDLRGK